MKPVPHVPTVGVEEEYQLVDVTTGRLRPDCKQVMAKIGKQSGAEIQHELHLSQIEMASPVCSTLEEVDQRVRAVRKKLVAAAGTSGCLLVAAGTNPLPVVDHDDVTPKPRYTQMTAQFQQIARDMRIFGCHVHVEMPDRELGTEVLNRTRRWLPLLQAISTNSPFLEGEDTGYASYRRELWVQWPLAGPPRHFENHDHYQSIVSQLVKAQAIADETRIYWDIRLPVKTPTIEYRVFDVMTEASHTVAIVAIVRALVMQATLDAKQGVAVAPITRELLVMSLWQAARYGIAEYLILPDEGVKRTASESLDRLLDYIGDMLRVSGDEAAVLKFLDDLRAHGTGADRQRRFAREHGLEKLVQDLAERTYPADRPLAATTLY